MVVMIVKSKLVAHLLICLYSRVVCLRATCFQLTFSELSLFMFTWSSSLLLN
jgi:hypothetical protein